MIYNIEQKIIDIIAYIGDLKPESIKLNSLIHQDLNIEDLDEIDMIMRCENAFNITITDKDYINKVNTVQDLINLIKEKVKND